MNRDWLDVVFPIRKRADGTPLPNWSFSIAIYAKLVPAFERRSANETAFSVRDTD